MNMHSVNADKLSFKARHCRFAALLALMLPFALLTGVLVNRWDPDHAAAYTVALVLLAVGLMPVFVLGPTIVRKRREYVSSGARDRDDAAVAAQLRLSDRTKSGAED
jgi:hypothetical protein